MAMSSLVFAIIGVVLFGLTTIIAIPFGLVGLNQLNKQVRNQEPEQKGRWMAITGIVIGLAGAGLWAWGILYL